MLHNDRFPATIMQYTYLVEADTLELATQVDALRTNAEDAILLESTLGVD